MTIGVEFSTRILAIDHQRVKLIVWDMTGNQLGSWRGLSSAYIRGAHAVMFVFDLSRRGSLDEFDHWMYLANRHNYEDIPMILIGNKLDKIKNHYNDTMRQRDALLVNGYFREYNADFPMCLIEICLKYMEKPKRVSTDKEISFEEGKEFADKYGIDYFETSAKTGENVDKTINELAKKMMHTPYLTQHLQQRNRRNDQIDETLSTSLLKGIESRKHCCKCIVL